MGVTVPDEYNTVFVLEFDDPKLADHQVKLRRSFGLVDAAADMAYVDLEAVKAGRTRPEDLARQRALVDAFAGALVAWNLEDGDGQPLPTDREAVRGLDIVFVSRLVASVMAAVNDEANAIIDSAHVQETGLPMEVATTG